MSPLSGMFTDFLLLLPTRNMLDKLSVVRARAVDELTILSFSGTWKLLKS